MRILVISQYFFPENFRINDLVFSLFKRGHQIEVLTGKPNYPNGDYFNTIGHWIQGRKSKFNISNWIKRGVKVPSSDLWHKFIDIYYKMVS